MLISIRFSIICKRLLMKVRKFHVKCVIVIRFWLLFIYSDCECCIAFESGLRVLERVDFDSPNLSQSWNRIHVLFLFSPNFPGTKLPGNSTLYVETQRRVRFQTKMFAIIFVSSIPTMSIFMIVAYDWCMGKYSIDSWHFLFPVW